MESSWIPWLVPLFPLIGYLIIAFFGRGLTGAPLPVVEAGGGHEHGHGHDEPDAGLATPTEHKDTSDGPAFDAHGHDVEADAHGGAHGTHDATDDHGHGHDEAHLSPGGTKVVGTIATLAVLASFVVSVLLFLQILGIQGEERRIFSVPFEWMRVPGMAGMQPLDLRFQLAVDPLSSLMLLIITGIGTLIHLYSTGYMSHDKGYARYFGYLNLFVFFMLLLVMGSNFLVMFVGWEGVGLASYLLIGFWYTRKSATDAGKKAFIVNRVGDAAFLIALFLIFKYFGTFEFYGPGGVLQPGPEGGLERAAGYFERSWLNGMVGAAALVPLLMFIGATGKSAQIPLYVWLPDAMEGPTPVSALIHAATMVTAGVYMVCRAHSLFLLSPDVMTVVAAVGLATAFLAATVGLVQNDIKKVLAYSTVSQLGLMFLAAGVGAFGIAMFHVTTHAFFKALLFLGSGSVIHAMSGEQDMRKMGGLGKVIKATYVTMFIGTLAISGIPGLSGFFSKDEILANAFASADPAIAGLPATPNGMGDPLLWLGGLFVSGMTAFYMWRMMGKTFMGQFRNTPEVGSHIHESPPSMVIPLWILAVLSIVGGLLNPVALGALGVHAPHFFEDFLGSTVGWREAAGVPLRLDHTVELGLVVVSSVVAVLVSLWAWNAYKRAVRGDRLTETQKQRSWLYNTLYNKWRVDEVYDDVVVENGRSFASWLWQGVDARFIDGIVNGVGGGIARFAQGIRGWQSGYVRNYALTMLIGVVLVILGCLFGLSALAAGR